VEGGAIAVLGAASLVIWIDTRLMPGWLIGPGTFFCIHHINTYALSPISQLWLSGTINHRLEGFVPAQWGAVLGLFSWALFYPIVFRAVLQQHSTRVQRIQTSPVWTRYGLALLAASAIICAFQYASGLSRVGGEFGSVSLERASVANAFQYTPVLAFFFAAYSAASRRGIWITVWLASLACFVVWMLLDGSRGVTAMAGCLSACGLVYGGMRRTTVAAVGILATLVFIPACGMVRLYRDQYSGRVASIDDRVQAFGEAARQYIHQTTTISGASDVFLKRISEDSVDYIFIQTPEFIPYAGFRDLDRVAYIYIPQVLWPDRPDLLDHNGVAVEYGVAREGVQGNSLSVVAEGYRRFGWPGIPFVYSLIAACSALVAGTAWRLRDRPEWVASLMVLIVCLNGEQTMATLLSTLYFLLWTLPKYFLFFLAIRFGCEMVNAPALGSEPARA
jgi:hypothetical protein